MRAYLFTILVSSLDVQTSTTTAFTTTIPNQQSIQQRHAVHTRLNARDDNEDGFVYAGRRRSGRREMEEGGGFDRQSTSSYSSSSRYQDNVEFFDLDDDDDELFDDEFDSKLDEIDTYNGIIPNPLLDAMGELYLYISCELFYLICVYVAIYLIFDINSITIDPDGVYERLGPELFKDWTFFRDMALFAAFLAFFTSDTHHYGTFDSVIEGMERLPADFIK